MPSEDAKAPPSRRTVGRDHLNLAEFPISVLQRQQPTDREGRKLDTIVYHASRYDAVSRRRVPQTVTLTTNSRAGLPTPADENVVLALLYLAKQSADFSAPEVHFTPWHLFQIMHWSPNSRSYERLRDVLRRLKSLTIQYENAWWDQQGRRFEEEFATGIIAAYKIVRQTGGRRRPDAVPGSWVLWNPDFYESLAAGSLKRLNLDRLFSLRLPTSQRMYRFLDKHFYHSAALEFDLREFACGHIGLSGAYVTPKLKEKLRPALAELEQSGFIAAAEPQERYAKVRPGVWRIRFRRGVGESRAAAELPPQEIAPPAPRPVEEALIHRGVSAVSVARLIEQYSEPRIRRKIDVFDWLTGRRDPHISRNPAGYLVASIRDDYALPAGYEPKERREARQAEQRQRRQAAEQHRVSLEQQQRAQQAAVDNWLAERTPDERAELERTALSEDNVLVKQYRRAADEPARAALRRIIIRAYAARRMKPSGNAASIQP